MEQKGSNQSLVKITNQHLIVQEVRSSRQLSRSDLAKKLQLSNPSVSKHVDDLIAKGLIVETGSMVTDVGRRPIMLEFNARHGCVAVIDLSSNDVRLCVADLMGNKLEYSRVEGGQMITGEVLERIILTLRDMLTNLGERCGNLVGVCIGLPGIIEPETGRILWSSRVENYQELDIRELFQKTFRAPVIVKNDVNLAVIGEQKFGAGGGQPSLLLFNVDVGVGVGVTIDGELYEGSSGVACDVGVQLDIPDDQLDKIQNAVECVPYMLEHRVNINVLTEKAATLMESGRETILRDWVSQPAELTFDDVVRAYGMSDPMTVQCVRCFARQIAIQCKNLCSVFDVEMILIGGAAARLGTPFLNEVSAFFNLLPGYSHPDIRISKLFETAVIFGGVVAATDYAIDRIIER